MEHEKTKKKKISKKRRTNAMLYPIYKAFSWDLLCFYSVEFLFYTITKGLSASQALMVTSFYIMLKMICQIPAVAISDYLGKRKSIILGNVLLIIHIITLMLAPDFKWIIFSNVFCALGYDLKAITEGNLLYDSVATRGGDGIYTQIDSKGATGYYIVDTILAIIAGYLFVINNYLPFCICLIFLIISLILSFGLKEIYITPTRKESFSKFIKGYSSDIIDSFKFIKKSKRIRAYIIFAAVFYSLIKIINTYKSDLLTDIGVSAEQFSMIYAILSLIAAFSASQSRKIQKYFRNKTLTVISLSYLTSIIFIASIALKITNNIALPFILIFFIVLRVCDSQWYVTQYTYLKNFTTQKSRNKISFTYELIVGFVASIVSLIGAAILDTLNVRHAMLLVGLLFLAIMIVVLDYMRSRIGLKPKEYTNNDLEFKISKEK